MYHLLFYSVRHSTVLQIWMLYNALLRRERTSTAKTAIKLVERFMYLTLCSVTVNYLPISFQHSPVIDSFPYGSLLIGLYRSSHIPPLVIIQLCSPVVFTSNTVQATYYYDRITTVQRWTCCLKYRIVENFRGRLLSQISQFCGYTRKFSPRNLGCGVLWHCKNEQSTKVFSAKIVFLPICEKFSPSKVSHYT